MKTTTDILFVSDGGRINCLAHGGSYLNSAHAARPNARTHRTPLDWWERVDDDYIAEWTAIVGKPPVCEEC